MVTKRPSVPIYNNDEFYRWWYNGRYYQTHEAAILCYSLDIAAYCTYLEGEVTKCEERVRRIASRKRVH